MIKMLLQICLYIFFYLKKGKKWAKVLLQKQKTTNFKYIQIQIGSDWFQIEDVFSLHTYNWEKKRYLLLHIRVCSLQAILKYYRFFTVTLVI